MDPRSGPGDGLALQAPVRNQVGLGHRFEGAPSDLFKRQVWATYQADFVGLQLIPFFGDGHMMWASDYPHPDSTWPNSQAVVEQETAHLSPDMQRKIVRDNAVALYGLE